METQSKISKKRGRNRRSFNIFSRVSARRSIRRRTVSVKKKTYIKINNTDPPNQKKPKTLTDQKSSTRNLSRWKRGNRSAPDPNITLNSWKSVLKKSTNRRVTGKSWI